jgi:hypothetical protein
MSAVNPMYQYLVIHGIAVQHLADRLNEYAKEDWRVKALIEGPNELPLALLEHVATGEALGPPFGQLTEDEKNNCWRETNKTHQLMGEHPLPHPRKIGPLHRLGDVELCKVLGDRFRLQSRALLSL